MDKAVPSDRKCNTKGS